MGKELLLRTSKIKKEETEDEPDREEGGESPLRCAETYPQASVANYHIGIA